MGYSSEGWFGSQFGFLRRQFRQDGELPFTNVSCDESIPPALAAIEFAWKDGVYTPLVHPLGVPWSSLKRRRLVPCHGCTLDSASKRSPIRFGPEVFGQQIAMAGADSLKHAFGVR